VKIACVLHPPMIWFTIPGTFPATLWPLPLGKLPDAARMKRIGNVIATVLVVTLNSKSGAAAAHVEDRLLRFPRHCGCRSCTPIECSSQAIQAVAEYMFVGHLRSVVVSVAVLGHEVHVWREVRIGDERFVVGNSRR